MLVTVPKSSTAQGSAGATLRVSSSPPPQSSRPSTLKIIPVWKLNTKVKWEDQVSGANKHGPSENTWSQTRDRDPSSSRSTTAGYQHLVVDKMETQESDTEVEEMQVISDDNSVMPKGQSKSEPEEGQWLGDYNQPRCLLHKAYSPSNYFKDVSSRPFCRKCRDRHPLGETIEWVVVGSEVTSTLPIKIHRTSCNALIDMGAMKSCISETYFKSLPDQNIKNFQWITIQSATGSNLCPIGFATCEIEIGNKKTLNNFIICKHLIRVRWRFLIIDLAIPD